MVVRNVEFTDLEKKVAALRKTPLDYLAGSLGKAYGIAIARDGCPAYEKQEAELERRAESMVNQHGEKVVFARIHIRQAAGSARESLRSKDLLGHYFYPTNLILIRTNDRGAIEYYRNASPDMEELEKNIEKAVETAAFIKDRQSDS
jgi:hypothetical protein